VTQLPWTMRSLLIGEGQLAGRELTERPKLSLAVALRFGIGRPLVGHHCHLQPPPRSVDLGRSLKKRSCARLLVMDEDRHTGSQHHHQQQRFVGGFPAEADVLRLVGDARVAEPERDPADPPPRSGRNAPVRPQQGTPQAVTLFPATARRPPGSTVSANLT
jgi:hypothetical protein